MISDEEVFPLAEGVRISRVNEFDNVENIVGPEAILSDEGSLEFRQVCCNLEDKLFGAKPIVRLDSKEVLR